MLKGKYMPLSEANVSPVMVSAYDGQHIYVHGGPSTSMQSGIGSMLHADSKPEVRYTMGNYLGGGIAGVVYEAFDKVSHRHVAIKILNPVGYKLCSLSTLRRGEIIKKGVPILGHVRGMTMENVYWIKLPNKRELIACYMDGRGTGLRELTLEMCVALWRLDPDAEEQGVLQPHHTTTHEEEDEEEEMKHTHTTGTTGISSCSGSSLFPELHPEDSLYSLDPTSISNLQQHQPYQLPTIPTKYKLFLKNRKCIYREIAHMHKLTGNSISGYMNLGHPNVLQLYDVLEFIQSSKSTIFLVLELATGGELFDRIRCENGIEEMLACKYIKQLLSGVLFCHSLGIVHRDLKPENLLLSESDELKIADFGLSAHYIANINNNNSTTTTSTSLQRLTSVVGSPHYVAPEILEINCMGYDGRQADMWSIGVILYSLLVGTLPFNKEVGTCRRFKEFCEWIRLLPCDGQSGKLFYQEVFYTSTNSIFPSWFFPSTLSSHAIYLMTCLLHPDANKRFTCQEAYRSKWIQLSSL